MFLNIFIKSLSNVPVYILCIDVLFVILFVHISFEWMNEWMLMQCINRTVWMNARCIYGNYFIHILSTSTLKYHHIGHHSKVYIFHGSMVDVCLKTNSCVLCSLTLTFTKRWCLQFLLHYKLVDFNVQLKWVSLFQQTFQRLFWIQ